MVSFHFLLIVRTSRGTASCGAPGFVNTVSRCFLSCRIWDDPVVFQWSIRYNCATSSDTFVRLHCHLKSASELHSPHRQLPTARCISGCTRCAAIDGLKVNEELEENRFLFSGIVNVHCINESYAPHIILLTYTHLAKKRQHLDKSWKQFPSIHGERIAFWMFHAPEHTENPRGSLESMRSSSSNLCKTNSIPLEA